MAIIPISNRYEGFIFNGKNSRTYGVYITEPAVFDAPERDAELITIPGRNGQLVQDNGRWENIQVTYHCALPTNSEADFIQGVQNFRNMLASNIGYQRLEDEINTTEYRMGAFVSGLGVDTINKSAGTFDVVFTCKPQRFLTSGETAVGITSGDTITNPTAYEARPTLQLWGYGNFTINGDNLQVISAPIGLIKASERESAQGVTLSVDIQDQYANIGDRIEYDKGYYEQVSLSFAIGYAGVINSATSSDTGHMTASVGEYGSVWICDVDLKNQYGGMRTPYFNYGTSALYTGTATFTADTTGGTKTIDITLSVVYDGAKNITATWSYTASAGVSLVSPSFTMQSWYVDSTQSALGSPLYFDLDIGEAYKIENDVVVSVNNAVTIPAKLPVLKPGGNVITYDNTITQLKVVPGWWRL